MIITTRETDHKSTWVEDAVIIDQLGDKLWAGAFPDTPIAGEKIRLASHASRGTLTVTSTVWAQKLIWKGDNEYSQHWELEIHVT